MRIIALDPGKKNFAAAVMENRKVVETRYLQPMKSLLWDDFASEVKLFRDNYFEYVTEIDPDCVLAERYMARPGVQAGAVGEYVNIMLGIIGVVNASKGIPTHLVTSAQWKNALTARYGDMGSKGMKRWLPHLSIHEADSVGIAVYAMEQEYPEEKGKLLNYVKRLRRYPHVGKVPDDKAKG
jgi:hypothetical protein